MNMPSLVGVALVHHEEGCRLTAYWDKKGQVWTIGWGSTRYEDGTSVQEGDIITQERADALALTVLHRFAQIVADLTTVVLSQAQFDALCSLVYNIGPGAYRGSHLRALINRNPVDPAIRDEWAKWCHSGGTVDPILVARRARELTLYFGSV